ncbi:MAG TPA: GNAT family N-acetyltransferase [Candidatus Eisenbacteria bacterium]|nr:GNAT family N-acetyltransferase [Candidatus Eisenbacteria bacterium]
MQGSPFARAGFLEALPLALPDARVVLLTARRGAALAGAVPLAVTRRWGVASAYSLPFGTYGGPLVDPTEPDLAAVRAELARALGEWLRRERVALGEVVTPPGRESAPDPAWAALASSTVRHVAHVVSLEGRTFEDYWSAIDRKTRKGARQSQSKGLTAAEEPEALAETHALYLEQARAWGLSRPYGLGFLRALLDHPSGFARLFTARLEGGLACGILVLTSAGQAFAWWSGAAPAARESLAYPFLITEIVRAMSAEGRTLVNLGSSGEKGAIERFKESLGAEARPLWAYRLAPRSRLARWALALKGAR